MTDAVTAVQPPAGARVTPPPPPSPQAARSSLAGNFAWMLSGQMARSAVQGGCFVLVARALGVQGYGAFLGVMALMAILSPYVGWGAGYLLIQHASRDRAAFREWWGYAVQMTVLSGVGLMAAAAAVSYVVLPRSVPLALVLLVAAAELVCQRLVDMGAQAFQAFHRLGRTAQLQVAPNLLRLFAAGAMLLAAPGSPMVWGVLYFASTVAAAAVSVVLVSAELGRPLFRRPFRVRQPRNGFYFAVTLSAQGIYNDIDKTMLVRLAGLAAAGVYGAAYRLVDVSFVPVKSLLYAAFARFFEHGKNGIGGTVAFARRLLPMAVAYAGLAGVALYLCAPLLPLVLGSDFAGVVPVVRWLAALPLLRALHYFAADALTGADRQGLRSGVQAVVGAANVGLNLLLIPQYSWRGAAVASLLSDGLLVAGMWASVWYVARVQPRGRAAPGGGGPAGGRA